MEYMESKMQERFDQYDEANYDPNWVHNLRGLLAGRVSFTDTMKQRILTCFNELYASRTWQPMETAPKDGTAIMAWHTVHKCPMAIMWKKKGHYFNGEVLNWYEKSYTTAWPEKCFSHWQPLQVEPPK